MNLETRTFDIRKVDQDAQTVTGIVVPWDKPANVGGYTEQFERGSIDGFEGVKLFWNHTDIIGKAIAGRETDEGYEASFSFSDTTQGRDARTLALDGVVDKFSVGFLPGEQRTEEDGTVTRTKVHLKEVSLVPFPAYEGAKISEVRAESNNATNLTKEDVSEGTSSNTLNTEINKYDDSEIRSELDIVKRELAVVRENGVSHTGAGASQFRSAGEFYLAYMKGDTAAESEVRAYTGATLSDSHTSNDWKDDLLVIVNDGRPLVNLFDHGVLGSHGNNVEFPYVSAVTGDVAVQAAEGDDLAYIEVVTNTNTAPVKTYGGYSEVSRQAIERGDINYLDAVLRAQASSYAKVTNAAVRSAIAAATVQTGTSFTLSSATAANFVGAVTDGVQKIGTNGYYGRSADFVMVSWDVYNKLANLADSAGRPIFDLNRDGSNTVGNVNVVNASASIAGLPVVIDPLAPAKTLYVANSHAVTVWENSGAPVRLNDENIINLTKQYSLYGYMAVGVKDANGLVKATIA